MQTEQGRSQPEGLRRAVEFLRERCSIEEGFIATPSDKTNYRRIWARDSCIVGLAALMTGDSALVDTMRRSLAFLARHQGPQGQIPSNVDPVSGRISYGGTTGRVDADLWFLIACGQYVKASRDEEFLGQMLDVCERVRFLLSCWEINARGLLYVPVTGDWADEYLQEGYVLYDQLLYLQALREMADMHEFLHGGRDHALIDRIARLERLIATNFWFDEGELEEEDHIPVDAYHEILYQRGRRAAERRCGVYWMPFFSPATYGFRFDGFANVLASLIGPEMPERSRQVDAFAEAKLLRDDCPMLPAFHPVITPRDEDWDDLQVSFSHTFKNQPYEFQNGGLWPVINGLYVADLVQRGEGERAREVMAALDRANLGRLGGDEILFPEYLHGKTLEPGGQHPMAWSAAGSIFGHEALAGRDLFRGGRRHRNARASQD